MGIWIRTELMFFRKHCLLFFENMEPGKGWHLQNLHATSATTQARKSNLIPRANISPFLRIVFFSGMRKLLCGFAQVPESQLQPAVLEVTRNVQRQATDARMGSRMFAWCQIVGRQCPLPAQRLSQMLYLGIYVNRMLIA